MATFALILALSLFAAIVSGAAGFGGALILLPFLIHAVGATEAVPILTIGQLFGNASRVWFGRKTLAWKPIGIFLSLALPAAMAGSLLFTNLSAPLIKQGAGALLIAMVVARIFQPTRGQIGSATLALGGGLTGFVSGVAGSAGPLGAAFFLALALPAPVYVASEAVAALAMHVGKILAYGSVLNLAPSIWLSGFLVGVAMVGGSWVGRKLVDKVPRRWFLVLVNLLLMTSGVQLILGF